MTLSFTASGRLYVRHCHIVEGRGRANSLSRHVVIRKEREWSHLKNRGWTWKYVSDKSVSLCVSMCESVCVGVCASGWVGMVEFSGPHCVDTQKVKKPTRSA